jgi:peptide-methionine (S)-S-oxide reductase
MQHHTRLAIIFMLLTTSVPALAAEAIFAGGCFWCMEPPFDKTNGVLSTESGYIGGQVSNPTYKQVSAGGTGHTEAVRVRYDPGKVSYEHLLNIFWRNIDPEAKDRQFCDDGSQYRSGIFYLDEAQKQAALNSRARLKDSGRVRKIYTEITPAGTFWKAEAYHQDYYLKNPLRYRYYRHACGRDKRLEAIWGKQ